MSAFASMEKVIKILVKTHPNPVPPIKELIDDTTDEREKEEIRLLALSWGIKLDEEEKL